MTTAALAQLAERVMGCAEVLGRAPTEGEYLIYGGGANVRMHPHNSIFFCLNWNPHTDPAQALALLEAWCKKATLTGGFGCYRHTGTWRGSHEVVLYRQYDVEVVTFNKETFGEAATRAVCAAEVIDLEATA